MASGRVFKRPPLPLCGMIKQTKASGQSKPVEFRLLLRDEDIEFLLRMRDFIDELIETVEIMSDKELLDELKEALEDVKNARLTRWEDFLREIRRANFSGKRSSCA